MYKVTNPATGEVVKEFDTATDEQLKDAIESVHAGYLEWRERSIAERAGIVHKVADLFAERTDHLAGLITTEMGKRTAEAKGEMGIVVKIFQYYADNAEKFLADEPIEVPTGKAIIQKRPLGALIGIMPWNYPYYQVARFAGPNLVLGNTILLKHAPICPSSSAAIEEIMYEAGVPENVYKNIYATNEQIAWMLADPRIQGVSLTGSERAGAAVAAEAGKNLKKVVLELGGSDPLIVLDTDDIDKTVAIAAGHRMGNTGQACNSPKRMIVHRDIYDEFVTKLTDKLSAYEPGDPADPDTQLAPLSSEDAAVRLMEQVQSAIDEGATVHTGGKRFDRPGAYVQPTVLTDIKPDMKAYYEELFGPVAMVFPFETDEEAIELANDTPFGLGSSIYSTDPERARKVGEAIDAGMVYVNSPGGGPELPFGGVKRSGIGRELGPLGIEEFMNKRLVRV